MPFLRNPASIFCIFYKYTAPNGAKNKDRFRASRSMRTNPSAEAAAFVRRGAFTQSYIIGIQKSRG